ncbi:glycosyltransferase family 39 protein [Chloroflexota bacterium]
MVETRHTGSSQAPVWLMVTSLVLLLIAAAHILLLDGMEIGGDEAWSIWQSLGTPAEIVSWSPYDWPPLYYVSLGLWRQVAGLHPLALRYLSVLIFLPGVVACYRVLQHWQDERAGLLGMIAYAGLGYSLFLTTELRGYAFVMGLLPLALWLTLLYFNKPGIKRGLVLGIVLTLMFYITFTSAIAFIMLGLLTLIIYGKRIWRWWLPVLVLLLLALPLIIAKLGLVASRTAATREIILAPFLAALTELFTQFTGTSSLIWAVLLITASILLLISQRPPTRPALGLLAWWLGGAVAMFLLNPVLGFFSPRYSWWLMLGLALWLGWGLSYARRGLWIGAALVLVGLMSTPGDLFDSYQFDDAPIIDNLIWLNAHSQPGDVILIDPNNDQCAAPHKWDYLSRVYLPDGPAFVDQPGDHRRIWYVHVDWLADEDTLAAVSAGRVKGEFVGPPECLIRLYEAPPDPAGILFANGMRFHGLDVLNDNGPYTVYHEGENIQVKLWWSADEALADDYSISLRLIDQQGQLVTQNDSGPQLIDAPGETSTWTTDRIYVEERELAIPFPFPDSKLALQLMVYQWQDNTAIPASDTAEDNTLYLQDIYVHAW